MHIDHWPVTTAAAAFRSVDGTVDSAGHTDHVFELASLTKPLFSFALLVAIEEGSIGLDDTPIEAGLPPGVTVRHLLAHASGLGPEVSDPAIAAASKRIYSNHGFEVLGRHLQAATGMTAGDYLLAGVCEPLGLSDTRLVGSPAHGAVASTNDLVRFVGELQAPTLIDPSTLTEATSPQFPELVGVLPGYGRQDPNPWGLGFELKGTKTPHWTSAHNSPETFGHFGRAGTMFWADPIAGRACVALADRPFGPWASAAWPILSEEALLT